MPQAVTDFQDVQAAERPNFEFLCAPMMATGSTINAVSNIGLTVDPQSAVPDAGAAGRLNGAAIASGQTIVQNAGPLIAGVLYRLDAKFTTSDGQTLEIWARINCLPSN